MALFASHHVCHEAAHAWFAANRSHGWANCPLTENRLVRVLANPAASRTELRAVDLARRLDAFRASTPLRGEWPAVVTNARPPRSSERPPQARLSPAALY